MVTDDTNKGRGGSNRGRRGGARGGGGAVAPTAVTPTMTAAPRVASSGGNATPQQQRNQGPRNRNRQLRPPPPSQHQQPQHHHRSTYPSSTSSSSSLRGASRRTSSSAPRTSPNISSTARHQFPLITSAEHTFVITRNNYSRSRLEGHDGSTSSPSSLLQQPRRSFQGIDASINWDAVRLVNYHCYLQPLLVNPSSSSSSSNHAASAWSASCPICLDETVACPRITKCGHVFCLPCLIHHLHSRHSSKDNNSRCPCCAAELHLDDVKPCRVVVHQYSSTVASSSSSMQQQQPNFIRFVKLHRVKACSAPYRPVPSMDHHKRSHTSGLPCQGDPDEQYSRFAYVNPSLALQELQVHVQDLLARQESLRSEQLRRRQQLQRRKQQQMQQQQRRSGTTFPVTTTDNNDDDVIEAEQLEMLSIKWAIQFVNNEIETLRREKQDEEALLHEFDQPAYGMRQTLSPHLFYHADSKEDVPVHSSGGGGDTGGGNETTGTVGPTLSPRQRPRADSMASASSSSSHGGDGSGNAVGGAMYLESLDDEYVFYQAEDGRLCFLSPYNVKCLQHEFSTCKPDRAACDADGNDNNTYGDNNDTDPSPCAKKRTTLSVREAPLPDVVEGSLLDVERLQLTPDVRNRLRFLSHLPLYTELCFAEVNLGRNLSKDTKKRFAKEFYSRQQQRAAKLRAEQRERDRELRMERQRVQDLKSRFQSIDPTDPFFHSFASPPELPQLNVTSEEFGPRLTRPTSSPREGTGVGDDLEIAATTDVASLIEQAPAAAAATAADGNNPALSFSQMVRRGGGAGAEVVGALRVDDFPALGTAPASPPRPSPPPPRPWGDRSALKQSPTSGSSMEDPPLMTSIDVSSAATQSTKKRGQKIVLLSTGGPRGGA